MGMEGKKRPISRIWPRREMKEDLQADPEKVRGLCGVLFLGLVLVCWVSCVPWVCSQFIILDVQSNKNVYLNIGS